MNYKSVFLMFGLLLSAISEAQVSTLAEQVADTRSQALGDAIAKVEPARGDF